MQLELLDGFYPREGDGPNSFQWLSDETRLRVNGGDDSALVIGYDYPDALGEPPLVTASVNGKTITHQTVHGFNYLVVPVTGDGEVDVRTSRTIDAPGDSRRLALKAHLLAVTDSAVDMNFYAAQNAILAKPGVAPNGPLIISMGVTDRCNLRCVICLTHHHQTGDNNAGLIDLGDNAREKFFPLAYKAQRVGLSGYGETLLYKALPEVIDRIAGNSRAGIEFITNGLLLSPAWNERILTRNVEEISISMDAATAESYRNVRGADFEKVTSNIKRLVDTRNERGQKHPRILMNMALNLATVHEAKEFVELGRRLGVDGVEFKHLHDNPLHNWVERKPSGFVFDYRAELLENDPERTSTELQAALDYAAEIGLHVNLDDGLLPFTTRVVGKDRAGEYKDCPHPWRWLLVMAGGQAYTCCYSKPIAHLKDYDTLEDLWNGKEYQRLRTNIRNDVLDEVCTGALCPYSRKAPA